MIIKNNISLKNFTTIRIGGNSKKIYFPESIEDISNLKKILLSPKTLIIGKGSNIAFSDNGYKSDIISLSKYDKRGISVIDDKYISITASISCARLAKFCHKQSIAGFEFLHGIPGTIGGALAMNAGAFKQSIWNYVDSVNIVNKEGGIKNISHKKIKTSYRNVDKNNILLFLDVLLVINKNKVFDKNLLMEYSRHRSMTQPIKQWSSGCIFKNPSKDIPASSLIDSLEITKRKIGGIYISKKHCNYFVNDGSGSCEDLVQLIKYVSELIKKKYNISVTREICIY
jgi:UDP-N-acetylmuramate dehydrogenase